ncbi:MAG: GGDEF domain-containing protein [Acidobacteriota bacterium]|nr:GGDEF domain-containing protein [Acidobacteriota bacterium]
MNSAFLPDLFALAMLVAILVLVRREHSEERANAWLLGLLITLVESIAHTFYAPHGIPARTLHVIVIDCYMLAGLIFVWASSDRNMSRRSRLILLVLNGAPLLALTTPYGLNLRMPQVYIPAVVLGVVFGVGSSLLLRRSVSYAALHLVGWTAVAVLVSHGLYRNAVYWALGSLYAIAALNFNKNLNRRSTGRLAIVTGFTIWALFFLVHPWIVNQSAFTDIASHMWNLQKSLISLGMILVMLEEQASSNAYLAHHDELTGLANRRMLASRLTLALERSERQKTSLALVVLDLDGFKKINDTLGHLAGDQVLREVASSLRRNVRGSDTVARMGGDEFIILAEGLSGESSALRFSESIRAALAHPIAFQGHSMTVSASMGIALYPDDSRDALKLLRIADQRMYQGKKAPMPIRPVANRLAAVPPA